jgi:hypothetical protein
LRPGGREATGLEDPDPDQRPAASRRRVAVWVVAINANPDEDRIREGSEFLMSQTVDQLPG